MKGFETATTPGEKHFNACIESWRKKVECCFGVFKARWGIFGKAIKKRSLGEIRNMMLTCVALYNWIISERKRGEKDEFLEHGEREINSCQQERRPLPTSQIMTNTEGLNPRTITAENVIRRVRHLTKRTEHCKLGEELKRTMYANKLFNIGMPNKIQ